MKTKSTRSREGWEIESKMLSDPSDDDCYEVTIIDRTAQVTAWGRTRMGAVRRALRLARDNSWDR